MWGIIGLKLAKNDQKFGPKKLEFGENFWSFREFLEWFGVFLDRSDWCGVFWRGVVK